MVNKDTQLLFSIASNPGNMGATVYNELFQYHNINAIYKPLKCSNNDEFVKLIDALRTIGAHGISVSMPFKKHTWRWFKSGNHLTQLIENANTIKDNFCYNTDYYGFGTSISLINNDTRSFVIFGDGAMSKTIQTYLTHTGFQDVRVLKKEHIYLLDEPLFYEKMGKLRYLINASPVGMSHVPDTYFTPHNTQNFEHIINVVIAKNSNLEQCAEKNDAVFVSGYDIFKHQLIEQFNIYFGFKPNRSQVTEIVSKL